MWSRLFDNHISGTKTIQLCTWVLIYILHFDFQAKPGSTSSLVTLSSLSQAGAQDLATPTPCALLWCLELNLMNCTPHPQPSVCFHMQTFCQLFSLQWRYSSPKNRLVVSLPSIPFHPTGKLFSSALYCMCLQWPFCILRYYGIPLFFPVRFNLCFSCWND